MSDVSTVTVTDTGSPNAKWLSQSLDRLHSPRKIHSELSKAYKQASSFFLTRRFPEALSAIEPVVRSRAGDSDHEPYQRQIAPIAKAEKKWRIKIWSFYLTLLNSIADLGLESGGAAFGRQCWRDLEAKIKHGGLWDEVVDIGYHGNEANLDAEVVVNLANLFLAHSPDQRLNQQHLELHLAHYDPLIASSPRKQDRITQYDLRNDNGRDTIRDLATHIQVLEIYILHILPRNSEWDYAQEFIKSNSILDDEQKDTFLQTLSELREDASILRGQSDLDPVLRELDPLTAFYGHEIGRTDSEVTVIPAPSTNLRSTDSMQHSKQRDSQESTRATQLRSISPKPSDDISKSWLTSPSGTAQPIQPDALISTKAQKPPQSDLLKRSVHIFTTIQKLLSHSMIRLSHNPTVLLRFVLFLVAFFMTFSRKDLRDRAQQVLGKGWERVRRTFGMGVKISYI